MSCFRWNESRLTLCSAYSLHQSWVRVFSSVIKVLSAEDNSSTEVEGQSDHLTEKQANRTSTSATFRQRTNTAKGHTNLPLVENPSDSSDTTSDSADSSDVTGITAVTTSSSESTSSESNETSEDSDSSDASKSSEESNATDSSELQQIKTQDCVNGTQSCESEEHFFQDIGDDAHYSVDNLMMPDEAERELSLRRWWHALVKLYVPHYELQYHYISCIEDFRITNLLLPIASECSFWHYNVTCSWVSFVCMILWWRCILSM